LAQIALEAYRANTQIDVSKRNEAKVKDFLMEFKLEKEDTDKEKRKREMMMNAKFYFSCLTGVGMEALSNGSSEQK
jgi:hypothetical protein